MKRPPTHCLVCKRGLTWNNRKRAYVDSSGEATCLGGPGVAHVPKEK